MWLLLLGATRDDFLLFLLLIRCTVPIIIIIYHSCVDCFCEISFKALFNIEAGCAKSPKLQ